MFQFVGSFLPSSEPLAEQFIFDPMSVTALVCTLKALDYKIGLQRRKITLHPPGSGAKRLAAGDSRDRSAEYIRPAIISCVLIYPPKKDLVLQRIYRCLIEALQKNLDFYNKESKEQKQEPLKQTDKIVQIYTQIMEVLTSALENDISKEKIVKTLAYDEALNAAIKDKQIWKKDEIELLEKTLQLIFREQSEERKLAHLRSIKDMRDKKLVIFEPIITGFLADQKVTALQLREGSVKVESLLVEVDDNLLTFSPPEGEILQPTDSNRSSIVFDPFDPYFQDKQP